MEREKAIQTVNEIFSLYEKYGDKDYIGEPVSQLEHMCQAAELARKEGAEEEVVLAAFFHDIGHLCEYIMPVDRMEGYGTTGHERLAGQYLRKKGFSEKIAHLTESHVQAKRYMVYKFPAYYEQLSEASKITLSMQGGMMTEIEAGLFEQDHLHLLSIKLREWDDAAKSIGLPAPSLEPYKKMALEHLLSQN